MLARSAGFITASLLSLLATGATPTAADDSHLVTHQMAPGLRLQLPQTLSISTGSAASCARCQPFAITNTSSSTQQARIGIARFDPVPPVDRSVGEWLYNYARELGMSVTPTSNDVVTIDSEPDETLTEPLNSIAHSKRFALRAIQVEEATAYYTSNPAQLSVTIPPGTKAQLSYYDGATRDADLAGSPLHNYLYWSMWGPLRNIAIGLERVIHYLLPKIGVLLLLVLLVLTIRILTFPINRWSATRQAAFTQLQNEISPEITDIKARLKGADQSEAILALYTSRGASPFGGLKGSVGLFVQIPILVAMFNVASESATLQGVSYAWIADISQPERFADWGIDIPLLGRFLNPTAIVLAVFMLWVELKKPIVATGAVTFAAVLGVLLYSFPAFLVIYWLLICIAQYVEAKMGLYPSAPASTKKG